MIRHTKRLTALTLAACIGASALSTGCAIQNPLGLIGPNLTLNFVIPLGLNGNPGLLNPFGIIQALVNGTLTANSNGANGNTGGTGNGSNPGVPPTVL